MKFKKKTSRINKHYCLKWVWKECYIPMWFFNLIDNLCHPNLLKSINCRTTKTFAGWSQIVLLSRREQWSNIINTSWEQLAFWAISILHDTWRSINHIIKKMLYWKCLFWSLRVEEGLSITVDKFLFWKWVWMPVCVKEIWQSLFYKHLSGWLWHTKLNTKFRNNFFE